MLFRRNFLDGRPFSRKNARPVWTRGRLLPAPSARPTVFFIGRAPSCLLGRTDGPELTLTPTCRPASTGRKPSRPLSCTARLPGDCSAATCFFWRAPVSSDGRIVSCCPARRLSFPLRSRVYGVDTGPSPRRTPVIPGRRPVSLGGGQFPLASSRVVFFSDRRVA